MVKSQEMARQTVRSSPQKALLHRPLKKIRGAGAEFVGQSLSPFLSCAAAIPFLANCEAEPELPLAEPSKKTQQEKAGCCF
jgi:hypothetical protein